MAADPNDPLTKAFKYRFSFARNHTLGNLMLSALEDAAGSFPEAISICERLLDARGHVYPSTLDRVTLTARTRDGRSLEGQAVACHSRTALERVGLRAAHEVVPYQPALEAIREADLIVLGPGSLFTSIIPNLLVPGVVDAIRASKGSTLFVCSLADMQGETWGLTAREHVERSWTTARAGCWITCWCIPRSRCAPTARHGRVHRCDRVPTRSTPPLPTSTISCCPDASAPCAYATRTCRPSRRRGRWSLRATSSIPFIQPGTILLPCAMRLRGC